MEKITEGKRYSKVERQSFDSPDELKRYIQKNAYAEETPEGKTRYVVPGGWTHEVSRAQSGGAGFLRNQGLPGTPDVYKWESGAWCEEKPPKDQWRGIRSIDCHIKKLGYERDSLEDLAARLITHAHRVERHHENGEADAALNEAIKLGRIMALARVYALDTYDHSWRGKEGAKARWYTESRDILNEIVRDLASQKDALGDDLPANELWPPLFAELKERGLNPDPTESQGDEAYSFDGDEGNPLKYGTFRTQLHRARKSK